MEYKVSEKIQKKFDTLTKDAKVQKALQFMEDDQNEIIDRQIELTLIPAPTNRRLGAPELEPATPTDQ